MVNTSHLVVGNTIKIVDVIQKVESFDELVRLASSNGDITLNDNQVNKVGTIQCDRTIKAISLEVINTVTSANPKQCNSFYGDSLISLNCQTPGTVFANACFLNTISISGKVHTFNFTKLQLHPATGLYNDSQFAYSTAKLAHAIFRKYHTNIPSSDVLSNL